MGEPIQLLEIAVSREVCIGELAQLYERVAVDFDGTVICHDSFLIIGLTY